MKKSSLCAPMGLLENGELLQQFEPNLVQVSWASSSQRRPFPEPLLEYCNPLRWVGGDNPVLVPEPKGGQSLRPAASYSLRSLVQLQPGQGLLQIPGDPV